MMCRWAPGLGCPSELRAGQSGPCAYPLSGASTGFAPPRPCALECERVCDMEADPASLGQGTRQPKAHMWRRRCGSAGKPLQHHARPSPWAPAPETWGRLLLAPLSPAHWSARPPQEDFPGPALPNFTTRRRTTHPEACALPVQRHLPCLRQQPPGRADGAAPAPDRLHPQAPPTPGLVVRPPPVPGACRPAPTPLHGASPSSLATTPSISLLASRQLSAVPADLCNIPGRPRWRLARLVDDPAAQNLLSSRSVLRSTLRRMAAIVLARLPGRFALCSPPPPGGPRDRVAQVTFAPAEFPGVHIHTGPFIHSRRQA